MQATLNIVNKGDGISEIIMPLPKDANLNYMDLVPGHSRAFR